MFCKPKMSWMSMCKAKQSMHVKSLYVCCNKLKNLNAVIYMLAFLQTLNLLICQNFFQRNYLYYFFTYKVQSGKRESKNNGVLIKSQNACIVEDTGHKTFV